MAQVDLVLTDNAGNSMTFEGVEVPQAIAWPGQQLLAVHQLVGGGRTIQPLGAQPEQLSWNGIFFGQEASQRARYLDTLRQDGTPVVVAWDDFSYVCVVSSFRPTYYQPWHLRYSIVLEVWEDATAAQTVAPQETLLTLLNNDTQQMSCLGSLIGDSTLSSLLADVASAAQTLNSVVESVTAPIAMASACVQQATETAQSALLAMVQPLSLAQSRVQTLLTNVDTASSLASAVTGATFAGAPPQAIQSLISANQGFGVAQPLYSLQGTLGRMQSNVAAGLPGASTKLMAVNGGDLQAIAAQQYGDATLWPAIAQVNGLSDPLLPGGPMLLQIPAQSVAQGGL